MNAAALAAFLMVVSATAGCPSRNDEETAKPSGSSAERAGAKPDESPEPEPPEGEPEPPEGEEEAEVKEHPHSDPSLEPIEGADLSPLPDSAILRYQVLRLERGCRGNYRMVLHEDGKVFYQENQKDAECEPPQRFDAPLPDEPRKTLDEEKVAEIKELIRERGFFDLKRGYRQPARDGAQEILEVQLDGKTHRVVVQFVDQPVVSAIRDAVLEPLYQ